MVAAFPATINQIVMQDGYSETPESNLIEFKPEVGPPKLRRRMSTTQDILTITMWLTSDEWDILKSFYKTDLEDGTLPFTWIHPRAGAEAHFAFEGDPPKVTSIFALTYVVQFVLRQLVPPSTANLLESDLLWLTGDLNPVEFDAMAGDNIEVSP